MKGKTTASAAGVIAGVISLAVLYQTGLSRFSRVYGAGVAPEELAQLKPNLLISIIPLTLRVGLATGFLVFVGRATWTRGRLDLLGRAAIAGISWLLLVGFVQDLLINWGANVSSVLANVLWSAASLASFSVIVAYVGRRVIHSGWIDPMRR